MRTKQAIRQQDNVMVCGGLETARDVELSSSDINLKSE